MNTDVTDLINKHPLATKSASEFPQHSIYVCHHSDKYNFELLPIHIVILGNQSNLFHIRQGSKRQ